MVSSERAALISLYPGEEAFPRSQRVGNWRSPVSPNVDSQVVKACGLPPHPLFRTQFRGNGSHQANRTSAIWLKNVRARVVSFLLTLVRVYRVLHCVCVAFAVQAKCLSQFFRADGWIRAYTFPRVGHQRKTCSLDYSCHAPS